MRAAERACFLRAAPPLVSPGAHRLVRAQQQVLPDVVRGVRAAGPQRYAKQDCYAWYVWPTSRAGPNDEWKTCVENATDAAHVLAAGLTTSQWTEALTLFAEALRAQRSRQMFHHDASRIDAFVREWSSNEYGEEMKKSPAFAAAFASFASAWQDAK